MDRKSQSKIAPSHKYPLHIGECTALITIHVTAVT